MKAPVLMVLLVMSLLSLGSAAVLLFDTKPSTAQSTKVTASEWPDFRWGEGAEAAVAPTQTPDER